MPLKARIAVLLMLLGSATLCRADAANDKLQQTTSRGYAFLLSKQKPDGSWQEAADPPGITALVLRAFVLDPAYSTQQAPIKKGYQKLLSYQVENGGIYKDLLANYNTAIAISALAAAHDPSFQAPLDRAVVYLKSLQWSDKIEGLPGGQKIDANDRRYGGFGYGRAGRPDMSNTQFALDALRDAGMKSDDPAYVAALKFVSRNQNASESNDQHTWASDDGGFVYTNDGSTGPAGEYKGADGRTLVRSYGSMTYAGLKSLIYAGLTHDDPRVKAAWGWITRNYSVEENPGLAASGPQNAKGGIFYYYHAMSRAMAVYGEPIIVDSNGVKHDWRVDLLTKIQSLQRPDGSWAGEKRWMEDNPVLVSAYTMLALQEIRMDLARHPAQEIK